MNGLAVAPLAQPRFTGLARWMLNKGLSWREDVSREHLVYSERELERIVRLRNNRASKAAERGKKRRRSRLPTSRQSDLPSG